MRKLLLTIAIAIVALCQFSFAGQLTQVGEHFCYLQDDGSYAVSKWIEMDINADGVNESYYFDALGFMLFNTVTPDGYQVNELGQWVQNVPQVTSTPKVNNVQNVAPQQTSGINSSNYSSSNISDVSEEMVWYVETGKKYHKDKSCSKMNNPKQIRRSQAESMGLEPCKKSKCYGNYF